MASSVTAAPPMALPRARADSWPSRVRSRMYSRSIPDSAASTVNTIPAGWWEPCSSPVRNSSPIPAARSCSASAASSRPRPSRLCSCTTRVTATPDARSSRASATARSSSGRVVARVEIFSAKIRVTPAARSESVWVSSDWRIVEARAYPIRTCPAGMAPAAAGRGSSAQAEPGLRSGGTGTLSAFARCGTSRNRAVWYCAATLPRPVRHGEPTGAAQEDIGQSFASTRRKSSSLTRGSFHGGVSSARPYATTRETRFALFGIWRPACFIGPHL